MNSEKNNNNIINNNNNNNIEDNLQTINQEEIKAKLIINFLKLISKFSTSYYPSIKEWKEFPSIEEISNGSKMKQYLKKVSITIKILLNYSNKKNNSEINRVLTFTSQLLNKSNLIESISNLNLLVNNGVTLIQLNKTQDEKEIKLIMINYISTIMKNFKITYDNTFAMLFRIIKDNLFYYNDLNHFFDYEKFFIDENGYLNNIIVPQINEEILLLNDKIKEKNFVSEFEIDKINYENDLDLLYLINVLNSFKDLIKFKQSNDEEKYKIYRDEIKEKLFKERNEKILENEKNKNENENKKNK